MARTTAPIVLGTVLLAGACAAPPPVNDFSAHDSASRMKSIRRAVEDDDASAVRHLVEQLDADSPAIRLLAIRALEELTGETNGYHHDAPRSVREPAVQRWVAYVNRISHDTEPADG